MKWKILHEEVVALNKDIQMYSDNVMFRIGRIRQILESLNMASVNTEPEVMEVIRMLMAVMESDYRPEKVKMKPEALENITSMLSIKELQTDINNSPKISSDTEEGQDMPPELLY